MYTFKIYLAQNPMPHTMIAIQIKSQLALVRLSYFQCVTTLLNNLGIRFKKKIQKHLYSQQINLNM
jgi:hypothetical protein